MAAATLTFLGHASFRLSLSDGRVILIDPWLRENPVCPQVEHDQPRCDYILLTHGHPDHCADVPALIEAHSPQVLAVYELAALLESRSKGGTFTGMGIGGTVELDGIRITMTRAFHSSSYTVDNNLLYAGMPAGLLVAVDGLATLYHAGDTDVFGDMQIIAEMYDPKVLLLPIGDHFTMGPRGAARAARYFDPSVIVPIHHGTFPLLKGTPAALKEALGADWASRVMPMNAGETAQWTSQGLSA